MKEILKQICPVFAPSGRETKMMQAIQAMVKDYADEIKIDTLGSLMVLKKGKDASKKLMFAAHADEIGLVVTRIDEFGFLSFSVVGGVNVKAKMGGVRVVFENGTVGIVCKREAMKANSVAEHDLFIDIAASSKEEATKLVKVGDFAVFQGDCIEQGNFVFSKALDDRAGCAVLIKTLQKMKKPQYDTWFVFTTQEEVGTRGAQTATYQIEPDFAFAIDVTLVGDNPQEYPVNMRCGEGVAIKARDRSIIVPVKLLDFLTDLAAANKIPYQMEVLPFGGTDAGAIQISKKGVLTGALSIPCRYVHTASEMIHKSDLQATMDMVLAIIRSKIEL